MVKVRLRAGSKSLIQRIAYQEVLRLESLTELRIRIESRKIRIPDVVVTELLIPDEEVFSTPPYLCIEIMSPDDTIAGNAGS